MHHHEQTIDAFTTSQAVRPEVLGVVVIGSVARGDERPDSDVDVYLVVTDDAYAAAARIRTSSPTSARSGSRTTVAMST